MDKEITESGENNMEHDPIAHLSDEELDIIFNRLLQDMIDGDDIEIKPNEQRRNREHIDNPV